MNDKTLTANQNPPKFKALEHLKQHMTKTGHYLIFSYLISNKYSELSWCEQALKKI